MAQTPYRDIISSAEVDFRFYKESLRDHSSNGVELASVADPNYTIAHGTRALSHFRSYPSQTWMTTGVTELTVEFLISADMRHLGYSADYGTVYTLLYGDWSVTLGTSSESYTYSNSLYLGFSFMGSIGPWGEFSIRQEIAAGTISELKGSPLHIIVSARYNALTDVEFTTYVNGWYVNDSSPEYTLYGITAAPTNTLSISEAPTYFLRMWDEFMDDELILYDMYQNAKKVLPNSHWVTGQGTLEFNSSGGGEWA